jgi:hypothetical protein
MDDEVRCGLATLPLGAHRSQLAQGLDQLLSKLIQDRIAPTGWDRRPEGG